MFSMQQKKVIAAEVEKLLLSFNHPEMPNEKPRFTLHVDGKESWSWADIRPNWEFEDSGEVPTVNPHNELVAESMREKTTQKEGSTDNQHAHGAISQLADQWANIWSLGKREHQIVKFFAHFVEKQQAGARERWYGM